MPLPPRGKFTTTGLFWSRLRKYTPVTVRMLARHPRGQPLTDEEIAVKSGLPMSKVRSIPYSISWDEISIGDTREFLRGCDVDLTSARCVQRIRMYLRQPNRFHYLRKSAVWETTFRPLQEWVKTQGVRR